MARIAQRRRQGGMLRRQVDIGLAGERFLEAQRHPLLVPAGYQRDRIAERTAELA